MKILPPSKHRYEKGITKAKRFDEAVFWYQSAVKRIISNPTYTGVLAQARYKSNFLHGGGVIETKEEEWLIIENAHQPIIDKDIYEAVQKISKSKIKEHQNEIKKMDKSNPNIFKGLVFCGDCGKHMYRSSRREKSTFVCFIYSHVNKQACTMKPIKEAELRTAVFAAISSQIKLATDLEKIILKMHESDSYQKDKDSIECKINSLKKKLEQIQGLKNTLREDCDSGILPIDDYAFMSKDFEEERIYLQLKLKELDDKKANQEKTFSSKNKWISEFRMFEKDEQLTAQMLTALVERIDIYDNKRLEIVFRYLDELEALQEYIINYKARDAYD